MSDTKDTPNFNDMPVADVVADIGSAVGQMADLAHQVDHGIAQAHAIINEANVASTAAEIDSAMNTTDNKTA